MKGKLIGYTWAEGESDARTMLIAVPGYTDERGRHPQLQEEFEVRPVEANAPEENTAAPGAGKSVHERGNAAGRSELAATMERILQHGRVTPMEINLRETPLGEIEASVAFEGGEGAVCIPKHDVVAALEALDMALRGRPEPAPHPDELTQEDEWVRPGGKKVEVSAWNSRAEELLAVEIKLAGMVAQNRCDEQSGNPISFGENHFINLRIEHDLLPAAEGGAAKAPYHIGVDKGDAEGSRCMVTILEDRRGQRERLVYSGEVDVDEHGAWHFTDAKNEEAGK